jgi:Ca-activated chloride channel family protein
MRYIFMIVPFCMFAGLLDFSHIQKANDNYAQKRYIEASKEWANIDNDEAKYNQANSLYKAQKYKEAKALYQSIKEKKLQYKKLHNIGNCNAKLGKNDEAIKSYEDALKIQEDEDTKYNLEMLKKEKKKENKKNKKKENEKKESEKDKKNKQDKKNKKKENKKKENKKKENKKKENKKNKKGKQDKKNKEKQNQAKQNTKPQPPISNMEERKWQKKLNQRNINTLMLPLKKGEKQYENNQW